MMCVHSAMFGLARLRQRIFSRSCQLLSCWSSALSKLAPAETKYLYVVAESGTHDKFAQLRAVGHMVRSRSLATLAFERFRRLPPRPTPGSATHRACGGGPIGRVDDLQRTEAAGVPIVKIGR